MQKVLWATTASVVSLISASAVAQTQPQAGETTSLQGTATPEDGAGADAVSLQEDIIVTGFRRSLESAQDLKRNSEGIVDSIVAEDIGKLPDTFASSALARISGVQVTRGGGEAANVRIRGLPDLSTTYNGREIFSAEGRSVAIQDFPAGTVAALEVYKSGLANMIEGGIGGQVNVRGRKPFDFKGLNVSGSFNGVNWEQSDGLTWNGNLLVSDRWDTGIGEMGFLVNASYTGIDFFDATREQSTVIATTTPTNAPGTAGGVRYPDAQGLFHARGKRWRPSVNMAFQWRPSPDLEIYADGLFQGYRGRGRERYMFFPIYGNGMQLTDLTLRDGTNVAQSATVTGASAPNGNWRTSKAETNTYQFGAGAIWHRDRLKISADVAYTNSKFTSEVVNIDFALKDSPVRNVVFEAPGSVGGPTWSVEDYDLTDPSNYLSRGLFQEYLKVGGKDIQSRLDLEYTLGQGFLERIQIGVRYNDRDANRDRGAPYIDNLSARIPVTALPVEFESTRPGFVFDNVFPIRTFAAIPYGSIRENLDALRAFYGAPEGLPAFNPTENFRANEKALAGYGQLKYRFDLNDTMAIDGVVGLRAVRTWSRISGFLRDDSVAGSPSYSPITARKAYTDFLPNASARLMFNPQLQLRLAYTKTRTRPNFFDLNPTLTVGPPPVIDPNNPPNPNNPNSNLRNISGGNPDLDPLTSNNFDIGLEWYFSRTGSLTGGLFRRDAKGFIARPTVTVDDPVYGPVRLTRPENIGDSRFQGAEIAFTSFLDIEGLPEWAKGFGFQANLTYTDAMGDLAGPIAVSANVAGRQQRFNGVSKWSYNLVALYERPFFSTRLAYNYRSDFVTSYSIEALDLDSNGQARTGGVIEKGRGQLDFAASVTPMPNVTIAFDVANLLGNPIRRYREFGDGGDSFSRQYIYNDRVYSLGVRFRL
ncbi:MAG: TonB-dependent receptor [Novosphingobium pentaromativorans]|uniref:TonB-dependent receptor n=1 Tax=Novosphingobium pentaromativorans TaxID=205844 RepID=A0A2W5QRM8_9SPHN|nr:MAG: TonB-dependent receptor [Novosphingobium pentaromativorans]